MLPLHRTACPRSACAFSLILLACTIFASEGLCLSGRAGTPPDSSRRAFPAAYEGEYEAGDGRILTLLGNDLGTGPVLGFLDNRTGRFGILFESSADTFVAGPGLASTHPVEVTLAFRRDEDGRVGGLDLTYAGAQPLAARRLGPFPEQPVVLEHGGVRLPGTVVLPRGEGPFPAVVLVHGGGTVRRQDLMPTAYFFARNGVAALAYDKRGSGEAEGPSGHVFADLAGDVAHGIDLLKALPEIDAGRIGLFGVSQGGWVAPLAAVRRDDVAFLILQVAPATNVHEREALAIAPKLRADGFPDSAVGEAEAFVELLEPLYQGRLAWEAYEQALDAVREKPWLPYVEFPTRASQISGNPDRFHDAGSVLARLAMPVLALYAGLDPIVPADPHARLMYEALRKGGNPDFTVVTFPGATHAFLEGKTGGRREMMQLNTFVSGYFDLLAAWLEARLR